MDQRAAWRLDASDAFAAPLARRHQLGPLQIVIEQKLLDLLRAVDEADQARPVIGERGLDGTAAVLGDELPPRGFGERRVNRCAAIDLRERTDSIPAVLAAERADMREFHVAPGAHLLDELIPIVCGAYLIEDRLAVGIDRPQLAVVKVHAAVGPTRLTKFDL